MKALIQGSWLTVSFYLVGSMGVAAPAGANYGGYDSVWGHSYGMAFMTHGFGVLFWVLVAALVIYVVARSAGRSKTKSSSAALDVLQERFARGEIDEAEYRDRRKVLEN